MFLYQFYTRIRLAKSGIVQEYIGNFDFNDDA